MQPQLTNKSKSTRPLVPMVNNGIDDDGSMTYSQRWTLYEQKLRFQEAKRWLRSTSIPANRLVRLFRATLCFMVANCLTIALVSYILATQPSKMLLKWESLFILIPTLLAPSLLAGAWTLNTRGHVRILLVGFIVILLLYIACAVALCIFMVRMNLHIKEFWAGTSGGIRDELQTRLNCCGINCKTADCFVIIANIVRRHSNFLLGSIFIDLFLEIVCIFIGARLLKLATTVRSSSLSSSHSGF